VGPNAIGKTTILEAIRLAKALLIPRYIQEGQQVLIALGAASPHPQLSSYFDFSALARDASTPVNISMNIELNDDELSYLKSSTSQIALELLKGQLARTDDQGQLALTQFLSSDLGKSKLDENTKEVGRKIESLKTPHSLSIVLTMDGSKNQIGGGDAFNQSLIAMLERRHPAHLALFSYFPADRAFPSGEVGIQIGSGEASNQIQSHIGLASSKYQRLKQTIVNNMFVIGTGNSTIQDDFHQVLGKLLPGKELVGLSITAVGTLKVAIKEIATGKIFDIDSMSSGEKGLILTFMLLRRSLASGGIALLDEPELHLNPAVCKNIIPFLYESIITNMDMQILLCTHSSEILGAAFDHPDCSIHHIRSHNNVTKIYERDNREVFDALRRLGTTAAESLFTRGNIFVEGDHDAGILEEGFYEQVMGYKISNLGGRQEIEKEIVALQEGEKKGELDKLNCFIFDLDRRPKSIQSSNLVHVLQWDRYCLENYLIDRKLLFDELADLNVQNLCSRGDFEPKVAVIAINQLNDLVAKNIYSALEPDNPGLRPKEIDHKSFVEIAETLAKRLMEIKTSLDSFDPEKWKIDFISKCEDSHATLLTNWKQNWIKLCSGKRLIDDLYKEYKIPISKFDLKRRLAKRMKSDQTEDWTLVKSKIRDALEG
jgi:hypothetical protein